MKARVEWKLEDCWVGVFWKRSPPERTLLLLGLPSLPRVDVWICLLPCLPLHVWWWKPATNRSTLFDLDPE